MELYCVSIEVDFCFGLQQGRLCRTDLSGLKLSVSIANLCSKLLRTEVKGLYSSSLGNRLFMFRTWSLGLEDSVIQFECVNSLTLLPVFG